MKHVTYIEHKTLRQRDTTRSIEDIDVEGILLVGDAPALTYSDRHGTSGHDDVELYPAVYNGNRAWLERRCWSAASPYSAYGTEDTVLLFEAGVKRFLERGVFNFPGLT